MKLSTRSRYGVRMMYELASSYGCGPVMLRHIAERQGISEKYLSKLIIPLKGARLVNSARGAHGGYMLARDPSRITLREIVEILEGDIAPVECVRNTSVCGRSKACPTRKLWCEFDRVISDYLEGITLQDLVKRNGSGCPGEYCI
ncbi:MAG TPA: Rrf2 family transcriptional regulator [Spirochaetota bacterium]|nr:Rrf2 family transcriptional regulator [Spirochaetota bacterium]HSA14973.1 Rrf2 family transcriptional regulator [Spirochaetota bacterium]